MSGSNPDIKTFVGEFAFREDTAVTNLMDGPGGDANDPLDYPLLNDIILANYVGQPADGYSLFNNTQYCPEFCGHELGGRIAPFEYPAEDADNPELTMPSASVATFIIPIYSGVIGLLMPDKKLLPLNLLPLDIEIVFSPHALYGSATSRAYTI